MDEIDPTSTPGNCPLAKFGSNNREALGMSVDWAGNRTYDEERVRILRYLVEDRIAQILEGEPDQSDPLRVFVKQEPHKLSKLKEGRYRLIQGVSLVDTMIDRIVFGEMARKATHPNNIMKTPCTIGWSQNGGGWKYIYDKFPRGAVSIDRKAWDWTVREWMVAFWEEFLMSLHPDAPDWWRKLCNYRITQLFREARFRFADGVEVKQPFPGIMKSGCLLTLILNSVSQTYLHVLAMIELGLDPMISLPICCGDDTAQDRFPQIEEYVKILAKYCLIKEAETHEDYVEFVGFLFDKTGYYPAYWKKHLFVLAHCDVSVLRETLTSYQYLYYNEPNMLKLIRSMAFRIDPSCILSDKELQAIANYQ
nr:hypothetical protein [Leuven Sobemo-like virus 1]